jgi:VHL beta domain
MPQLFLAAAFVTLAIAAFATPAAAESCDLFGKIKSPKSTKPVTVTFINKTGEPRYVDWLDFKGEQENRALLQPGEKTTVKTFVRHSWMFSDEPGNCHEIYVAKAGDKTFRITVQRKDLTDQDD